MGVKALSLGEYDMNLKKINNAIRVLYQDVIELLRREEGFKNARPYNALLFLTFRCTSRCRSCSMWKRSIPDMKELDFDGWKRIADELFSNGVRIVELMGGDVLLRKDILIPFIRYLKHLEMIIHMPTNAILLDEEMAYSLVDSGIDVIYISVDNIGEQHDKTRGVKGNFKRLENGVELLLRARGDHTSPVLFCNTTISNMNIDSVEHVVAFAHNIGFDVCALEYVGEITRDHIEHSPVDGIRPDPYFIRQGDSLLLKQQQARELKTLVPRLVRAYSRSKMDMYTPNVDTLSCKNLYKGAFPATKCHEERNQVTVDPYGNVIVCPFFSKYTLGNLCDQPLSRIWNNQKHLKFRRHQNSGSLEICRHCIMTVERSYGLRKGLERIYYNRIRKTLLSMAPFNSATRMRNDTNL